MTGGRPAVRRAGLNWGGAPDLRGVLGTIVERGTSGMKEKIRAMRAQVRAVLQERFSGAQLDEDGDWWVPFGSARLYIHVEDFGSRHTVVRLTTSVLAGVKLTADLYKWAATEGQRQFFGSVMVHTFADGTHSLLCGHSLLGDLLDADELVNAVEEVGAMADQLDDELQPRFGGRKFNGD